jgi:hypothetical protein
MISNWKEGKGREEVKEIKDVKDVKDAKELKEGRT